MLTGLQAILPLFFIIGCGYVARRTVLNESMLPAINQFVYFFAVPALLFRAARQMSLEGILYWPGISGFLLGILLTLGVLLLANRWLMLGLKGEALIVHGMNATFANYAYMGIPLTFTLLGDKTGPVTVMIILLGNLLIIGGAHLAIETRRQHRIELRSVGVILNNAIVRNPIFISTLLGLCFSLLNLPLPGVVTTAVGLLADAAIPVALFCLGAGLQFRALSSGKRLLCAVIAIKLICQPALTWLALWLLGVSDPIWLAATVLLSALPTGALAHVVALKYNSSARETSRTIVLSTLVSVVTVSVWVALVLR